MNPTDNQEPDSPSGSNTPISKLLQHNIQSLQSIYSDCDDVIFHMFTFGNSSSKWGKRGFEELIRDSMASPFPQVMSIERPDIVAASLLEGRAAIGVDGTAMALIAPTTLYSMLQSPEDYYQSYIMGSFIRWTRYLFLVFALLGPSIYVAVLTFHSPRS